MDFNRPSRAITIFYDNEPDGTCILYDKVIQ